LPELPLWLLLRQPVQALSAIVALLRTIELVRQVSEESSRFSLIESYTRRVGQALSIHPRPYAKLEAVAGIQCMFLQECPCVVLGLEKSRHHDRLVALDGRCRPKN
jgi:hypothetical protein